MCLNGNGDVVDGLHELWKLSVPLAFDPCELFM